MANRTPRGKPVRIGCYRSVSAPCASWFGPTHPTFHAAASGGASERGVVVSSGLIHWYYRDSVHAAKQLVDTEKDGLDYLVADYLAEVTMGLLARRSRLSKDPAKARPGYSGFRNLKVRLVS